MSPAIAQPEQSTTFLSRRTDLRLVLKPRRRQMGMTDGGFSQLGEAPGLAVEFKDGTLRLPLSGQAAVAEGNTVDVADLLPLLQGHRLNGDLEDGFWELPKIAPPPSNAELAALHVAAANLDVAAIERMIAEERAAWDRAAMIDLLEQALGNVSKVAAKTEAIAKEADDRVAAAEKRAADAEAQSKPASKG